ncbi:CHAT domain-containing protein [Scytonema sp. UIC 10036]|uniref:CHAT domain-containing protein n=1 Tax=Scytonema sp. UIC 10036 TaxID=2304196 RepID=UPI001A9C01E6|nr:CHAT domain-containing protein [Scytonema sp. UIC 10036]
MTKPKKVPVLASRAVTLFVFLLLLSKSTAASVGNYGLRIAQQPATISQNATRAAAQKALDEGMAFYKQGTVRSLKRAIVKWEEALKLWQQVGDKDTLLLQYSLGKERSFLWVVSPNSLDTYSLPKKQEIEKSAVNLFCLISYNSSKPPSVTNKENPCARIKTRRIDVAAKELSQLILAPVKDKLGTKRLVIVADGALQYVPFAALADLTPQQPNLQGKREKDKVFSPNQVGAEKEVSLSQDTQKDTFCVGGGISTCQNHDSPQNKLDYQPLFVNHEIVNLPSASTIAIQRQELATRKAK